MQTDQAIAILVLLGLGAAVFFLVTQPAAPALAHAVPLGGPATVYNNDEEWSITRDPRTNRIVNIGVHRDARVARTG
jgi:hypothetical protein